MLYITNRNNPLSAEMELNVTSSCLHKGVIIQMHFENEDTVGSLFCSFFMSYLFVCLFVCLTFFAAGYEAHAYSQTCFSSTNHQTSSRMRLDVSHSNRVFLLA